MRISPLAVAVAVSINSYQTFASESVSGATDDIELVTVLGERPFYMDTLSQVMAIKQVDARDSVQPMHLSDILANSPEISLNGQGGLFQVVSIRGFSRWRVQSLIDGVPIVTDRRAGSSLEFIPPSFIQQANILTGAASTQLGSGAIGGGVDFRFAPVDKQITIGGSSNQSAYDVSVATPIGESQAVRLAYRHAHNGEAADGTPLNDHYEQLTGLYRFDSTDGPIEEFWTVFSDGDDIGKSNSDFPDSRITNYPTNNHWLGKVVFSALGANGNVYWHQSRLKTDIERPGNRLNKVLNESFDYGGSIGNPFSVNAWQGAWRVEGRGRSGVNSTETEFNADGDWVYEVDTLDADEQSLSFVVDGARKFERSAITAGVRTSSIWQSQRDIERDDQKLSAFLGGTYDLSSKLSASGYLSTGFRFPSLTERFFTGETPRGRVIGDADLETEDARQLQLSLGFVDSDWRATVDGFYQRIDNYIERIRVDADTLQYVNLDHATISGLTYDLTWKPSGQWYSVQVSGQWLDGEDQSGDPVADVSPHQHRVNFEVAFDNWFANVAMDYRAEHNDVASGERALDSVVTADASIGWQPASKWQWRLGFHNMTDELYYVSTDDKAPYAQGRRVSLQVSYLSE